MSAFSVHDERGYFVIDPEDDRCAHYEPKKDVPNLYRCACCVSYDMDARRCKNPLNTWTLSTGKEARDGKEAKRSP